VLPEQRQQDIYNQEEMHEKLEEIMWEGATFADTRATTSVVGEEVKDIEDDLQRELVFYNQVGRTPHRLHHGGLLSFRECCEWVHCRWESHSVPIKQQLLTGQQPGLP